MAILISLVIIYLSYVVFCVRKNLYSYQAKHGTIYSSVSVIGGAAILAGLLTTKVRDIQWIEVKSPNCVIIENRKYLVEGLAATTKADVRVFPSENSKAFEVKGKNIFGVSIKSNFEFK